jgi:hypothetical protein
MPSEPIRLIRSCEIKSEFKLNPYAPSQLIKILSGLFLGFVSIYQGMAPQMHVVVLLEFVSKCFEAKLEMN